MAFVEFWLYLSCFFYTLTLVIIFDIFYIMQNIFGYTIAQVPPK